MLLPLQQLPLDAKVWIFQSDKTLQEHETEALRQDIYSFVEEWTAHKRDLYASGDVLYHKFIVIMVDEQVQGVSGCSLDTLTHFIQNLGIKYHTNFLDRMQVAFIDAANENTINTIHLHDLKSGIANGSITKDTLVFNNLIKTKKELETDWKVKLSTSWHQKFI